MLLVYQKLHLTEVFSAHLYSSVCVSPSNKRPFLICMDRVTTDIETIRTCHNQMQIQISTDVGYGYKSGQVLDRIHTSTNSVHCVHLIMTFSIPKCFEWIPTCPC